MTVLSDALFPYQAIDAETVSVTNFSVWSKVSLPASSILLRQANELTDDIREILSKIKSFSQLGENWDSYGAAPPSKIALQNAFSFVKQIARLQITVFFTAPGPNGEILVELQEGNKSIEVTFESDGTTLYARFIGVDCAEEGRLDDHVLSELAKWILP